MDTTSLKPLIRRFLETQSTDALTQRLLDERAQARKRASRILNPERIPTLTREELEELLVSTDAWQGMRAKQRFTRRLFGEKGENLPMVRKGFADMLKRAQAGLTAQDFDELKARLPGIGRSFLSEILAYRFPEEHWELNKQTVAFLEANGVHLKDELPRGKKSSDGEQYMVAARHLTDLRDAISEAKGQPVDNLFTDIFIYWANQQKRTDPWSERIQRWRSELSTPERLRARRDGEGKARDLLLRKLGRFDETDLRQFMTDMNKDWGKDRLTYRRFGLALYGAQVNLMAQALDAFNRWVERLWQTPDDELDEVLNDFWAKEEVKGAGVSLPTAVLYLRDQQNYCIWLPAMSKGLSIATDFVEGDWRTAHGYRHYNAAAIDFRSRHELPPTELDLILWKISQGVNGDAPYLLLRSNVESPWEDEEGRAYHYGSTVANHKVVAAGAHFLVDRRFPEGKKIVGRGRISDVVEDPSEDGSVQHFRAELQDYQPLRPPRVVTPEVESALQELPRYNRQHSIRILTKQLFEELSQPARAWIFQANPKYFDVRSAVHELEEDTWLVLQHKERIEPGDRVYLWESGPDGGIVGLAEVVDQPSIRAAAEEGAPFVKNLEKIGGMQLRVGLRILEAADPMISRDEIRSHPSLSNLSISRQPQGTNFPVTRKEAEVLEDLLHPTTDRVWLQGADHEAWLRQALEQFQGFEEAYPQKALDRAARHDYFAKAFSPETLEGLRKEGFSELLHEFLYDHGRVGMTGAWRKMLEDDSEHVRQVLVSMLDRVSSGDPVAQVVDEALDQFSYRAILFVSCVLHDFDWDRYAIFFPTVWKRMESLGIWPETEPGLTAGETYQLACAIQKDFAAHFELENLDRTDDFLWWAVQEEHLKYPPIRELASRFKPDLDNIRGDLRMADAPIHQLVAVVNTGRHALICGPPGTGKTTIAQNVAKEAQRTGFCSGYLMTTATSDWTTFDTIGGYMPAKESAALEFSEGMFLRAIREDRWLILDELNRADIDKAFGQLFTTLSGQDIELPFRGESGLPMRIRIDNERLDSSYDEDSVTYWVGRNWRIIATMNTFDKNALFTMSFAFMRRFAFVEVGIPERDVMENLIDESRVPSRAARNVKRLLTISPRRLGPAIVLDLLEYIKERDDQNALLEALRAYVLPQFEGLETPKLYGFYTAMAPLLSHNQAQEDLKQYMAEFFELDKDRLIAASLDMDDTEEAEQNLD